MQFHLNGFKPGDPEIAEPARAAPSEPLPQEVDVLIVGCGPAGLTLAAQLAAFPEITTCIVEEKPGPLLLGQADGIACRTMEMFEAFGFSERVLKEAYWVNETTFWKPGEDRPEEIVRSGRIQDTEDGLSEFPHVILNQARVHDRFLEVMRHSPSRLEPAYSRRFLDQTADDARRRIAVRLERTDAAAMGQIEYVRTRYLVGADGARSAVRKSLGLALRGDSANQAWGVMDVLAVTDFPDIRLKSAIHSATQGSVLVIPREGGYLVRLYIELNKLAENERVANQNITADHLIAAAQRILHPYRLDVKEVAWWSVYEIGQRLCSRFDNLSEASPPNVLIVGDACHTHSPNLGWKLAAVLRGQASSEIVATYSDERQSVAAELIEFDRKFARMFSAQPKRGAGSAEDHVDPAEFQAYFVKQGRFTAGTETQYAPSLLCGPPAHQPLAAGFVVGKRFHSAPVIRLSDAKPVQLGHVLKADGRWRLIAFAADEDPAAPGSTVLALCDFLETDPRSPVRRWRQAGADVDAVIDVRAVFQQGHREVRLEDAPAFLLPRKGRYGLIDYERMFCADRAPKRDIFELRGIDRTQGCVVVIRPDQYVAHVFPLDAVAELAAFFSRFTLDTMATVAAEVA